MAMDIADIKNPAKGFGNKYDDAMKKAIDHAQAKGLITPKEAKKLKAKRK